MMQALEFYQKRCIKIIEDNPSNVTNKIREFTMKFYTKIETPPPLLRQRTFLMILMANELKKLPACRSTVSTIFEEIFFCVNSFLSSQNNDYKSELAAIDFTSLEMTEDTLPIILEIRPRKIVSPVKALYKITDEHCQMAIPFKRILRGLIETLPGVVVEWLNALQFEEFKKEYFDNLIVSIMINALDLKAILITSHNDARKIVEFLDKTLDRKAHRSELYCQIRSYFTDADIVKKIFKIAKEYSSINTLIYCPNSVRKRRMCDYIYNMHQRSKEESAKLSVHCMEDFNELDNFDVIRALTVWEKKEKYAGVAYGRMLGLSDDDLAKICIGYANFVNWDEDQIKAKIDDLDHALESEAYLDEFVVEGHCTLYLIDNLEKLRFAMKKLAENEKCAFDVEASYVCQNVDAISQACLLQIAFKDCVLLIDIFTLVQKVPDEHIRVFFEIFLGTDIERICFDIKSDLGYLRHTFKWMPDYIQRVQPTFHCVQRFVKIVHTTEAYQGIFEDLPTPSLAEVASKWLKKDLSKDQRTGNWLQRPLTKEQMVYAATDAWRTLDAYYYIQKMLNERNLIDEMEKLVVKPEMIDRKRTRAKLGHKETMEEILSNVQNEIKIMHETLYNLGKSHNYTIVVDTAFLFLVPYLRQFGYKTFDYRGAGDRLTRDEAVDVLAEYIEARIADGTITHCFLLTDKNSVMRFTNRRAIDELKIISRDLDETESSIICSIMYATKTIFDLDDIPNRCPKCGLTESAIDFPADVFRLIYIHFAKVRQFFDKLKIDDNSAEIREQLESDYVEFSENWMTYYIDDKRLADFYLGDDEIKGFLKYENENNEIIEEKKKYKCNTRIFGNLGDKSYVRFCYDCFEFF